jgi:hypothetical protein
MAGAYHGAEGVQVRFGQNGAVYGLQDVTRYTVSTYFCEDMSIYDTDIVILSQADTDVGFLPRGDIYVAKWENGNLLLYGVGWPEDYDINMHEVPIAEVPDLQLTIEDARSSRAIP